MIRLTESPVACNIRMRSIHFHRGIEQLAARQAHNLEVAGSSPAPATKSKLPFSGSFDLVPWLALSALAKGSIFHQYINFATSSAIIFPVFSQDQTLR
jgi:hypothetical protein